MNNRGQVFLMAALIVAGIVLSLVKVSNKGTSRQEPEAFYDLADEIGFEVKRVLDYGIIKSQNNNDIKSYAKSLINNYSEYISKEDVVFIYGDLDNKVWAYSYNAVNANVITFIGGTSVSVPMYAQSVVTAGYDPNSRRANVKINGVNYDFDLNEGQNFYFVLIKEDDGEKYVTIK